MGQAPYAAAIAGSGLSVVTFSPGKGLREAANAGRVEMMRTPLSGIPKLFHDRILTVDVLVGICLALAVFSLARPAIRSYQRLRLRHGVHAGP